MRRLVLVSGGFAQDGFYPEMLPMQAQVGAAMAEQMKDTPMYQSYVKVAPNPEDFPRLLDAMGELMRTALRLVAEDVKKLTMPVMLVYGDSDMYRPEHVVEFYQLLGGGLRTPAGSASTCRRTASRSFPTSRTTTSSWRRRWLRPPAVSRRQERREELGRASQQ